MTNQRADLHTHSLASDGAQPSSVNVQMAEAAGLGAIAITDHDTVAGIEEALAEGARRHVEVVPGVEISTVANDQDIHVLGYFIDYQDATLLARLASLRRTRDLRNEMMIRRLQDIGIAITMDEVMAHLERPLREGESIGRPHIAAVLIHKGYARTLREAFDRYLGKQGTAYVNPPRIRPEEAIAWIREAGGAAVLAHPGLYGDDQLVKEIIAFGLDGLEAYHSDHSPEEEAKYAALAAEHRLIVTAGSDFHGERNGEVFHGPIGNRTVGIEVLEQLRKRSSRQA